MAEIWIVEEPVSNEFLDDLGHYMSLDGKLDSAYFISADGENYVDEIKTFYWNFYFTKIGIHYLLPLLFMRNKLKNISLF